MGVRPEIGSISVASTHHNFNRWLNAYKSSISHSEDGLLFTPKDLDELQKSATIAAELGLNLKLPLLSPVFDMPLLTYGGSTEHRPGQLETIASVVTYPRLHILNAPRTGKTFSTVSGVKALMDLGEVDACLIVTTVSSMVSTYAKELPMYGLEYVSIGAASSSERNFALHEAQKAQWIVMNYDTLKIEQRALMKLTAARRFAVIFDEVTFLGNTASTLSKVAFSLVNNPDRSPRIKYVYGLTGTPDNPMKCHSIATIITPKLVKMNRFAFERLCYNIDVYTKAREIKPDHEWADIVRNFMLPCIRVARNEDFSTNVIHHKVDMTPSHKEAFNMLKRHSIVTDSNGVGLLTKSGSGRIKLLQLALGIVEIDSANGGTRRLEQDITPIYEKLKELICANKSKTVIFVGFLEPMADIHAWLSGNLDGTVGLVNGGVTGQKRKKIFEEFSDPDSNMGVLIAHPRTCAHSVEFAHVASEIIFVGSFVSGSEVFIQASDRIKSAKQSGAGIKVHHVYCTEEERITIESVYRGENLNSNLLDYFKKGVAPC